MRNRIADLAAAVLKGDVRAAAKAISLAEAGGEEALAMLRAIYPKTGGARRIGLTGPPGAGKSTLAGRLALRFRRAGLAVGVLAVDASSPFTGGALLGDRIRMQEAARDPEVFIRSMGNGGLPGGLSASSTDAVRVMEAMGKQVVLVETVGAGQSEVEAMHLVDTLVVVMVPESGDAVQAMKAGLLEAADIVVVNKGDRPGAEAAAADLAESMGSREGWEVPVVRVSADRGEGIEALAEKLSAHAGWLDASGAGVRRRRAQLRRELQTRGVEDVEEQLRRIDEGESSPYAVL